MTTSPLKMVMVTGAHGFLGRWLLVELTGRGTHVLALLRRPRERRGELAAWMDARGGDSSLLQVAPLDLDAEDLGLDAATVARLPEVEGVVHLAARFDFGLDRPTAVRANVDAPVALIRRMADQPKLRRFVHVSGYRTEGRAARELDVDDPEQLDAFYAHHGAYEASKVEAHVRVARAAEAAGVPLTRVSPALVIGDSRTGETSQLVGLAETLRQLWAGRLPALPGSDATWMPVIGVDVLARTFATVLTDEASADAHLVVFDDRTPDFPTLLAWCAERLGRSVPRLKVPTRVLRALPTPVSGVDEEALSFVSDERYDPTPFARFRERVGLALPDVRHNVERWVDGLVASGFGALPARGGNVAVAGTRTFVYGVPASARTVLLHGLFLDGRTWSPILDALPPALVPDLPGLGRSGPSRIAPETWLRALLQHADEPVDLVAQSLGTAFAVAFAHQHPARVRRLTLVSPFFLQGRPAWWQRQPWLLATLLGWVGPHQLADVLEGPLDPLRTAMLEQALVQRQSTARWLAWTSRREIRARLVTQLAEIEAPVTLVVGERDPLRTSAPAHCTVITVPNAGHQVQLTHPDALLEVLRDAPK